MNDASGGAASPGSGGAALRAANEQRVLDLVRESWGRSQAQLSRASGLSPASISGIVARLASRGLVTRSSAVRDGRRVQIVAAADDSTVYGGVDIGRSHVRVLIGDGTGRVLRELEQPLAPGHRPSTTLTTIQRLLHELVDDAAPRARLTALGVGLPGPLDRDRGAVVSGTILPGWVGIPVSRELAAVSDHVIVENDSNLGALALHTLSGAPNLIYVKAGSGVGAGIIINGDLYGGTTGLAGEFGHIAVSDVVAAPMCRCGKRGCLETYASTESLASTLSKVLDRRVSLDRLVHMSATADPVIRRIYDDAGEAIGRGLGIVSTLLDPGLILIGGPLAALGTRLLEPVQAGFSRNALPAVASHTTIALSPLGERAEALGALQLARSHGIVRPRQ